LRTPCAEWRAEAAPSIRRSRRAWSERDPLNDRERQVLRLAAEGKLSAAIADGLGLSRGTVRNYLSQAIAKLGASNRVEAARTARQKGWL
jgi:two-component system response regulator DesR